MMGDLTITTDAGSLRARPRVRPPQDDTMKITIEYGKRDQGLYTILTAEQIKKLAEYLDSENVPPYVAPSAIGECALRVIQESDGRTWVRVYRMRTGASKLLFLSDHQTGQLYDFLTGALSGEWDGWKFGS